MPKISVIVPVFQHAKFISECLNSLLAQSLEDWEAIIIDDRSDDGSGQICNKFAQRDSRIKYYFQENKGILKLSENFNRALELSSGEFIAVLEGDDYWPKNKLENQIRGFSDTNVGVVWGDGEILIDGKISPLRGYTGNFQESTLQNDPLGIGLKALIFSHYFNMPTISVMYRREILDSIGGFYQPARCSWNDKSTWAVLACVTKFAYLNQSLGTYRRHPSQVTNDWRDTKTTFEYILDDKECPQILRAELSKIESETRLFLAYRVFSRSAGIQKSSALINLVFKAVTSPIAAFNIMQFMLTK